MGFLVESIGKNIVEIEKNEGYHFFTSNVFEKKKKISMGIQHGIV